MNELFIFMLIAFHYIVDFPLQTRYQWENKGIWMHPGGLVHSGLHGIAVMIAIVIASIMTGIHPESPLIWAAIILVSVSHYLIDYVKININVHCELTPESPYFWWLLGLDQFLHVVILLVVGFYLF